MRKQLALNLPDQIATFAKVFADTGSMVDAAVAAGVHPGRAPVWSRNALDDPNVKAAVEQMVRNRYAEAGPLALNVIVKFAKNENAFCSRELQLAAARDLANRAGFTAKDMRDAEKDVKDLAEMSPDELRHVLEHTEQELATRAKEVASAPERAPSDYQVIDLEG